MSNSTSIYITVIETPLLGCLPIAYKTFLSDAPDELTPKKVTSTSYKVYMRD